MGLLKPREQATISKSGSRFRSLTEQADVYHHGFIRYKTGEKYKICLALLRPGQLTLRNRVHLDRVEAIIRLAPGGVKFHDGQPSINRNLIKASNRNLVKFELTTCPALSDSHGRTPEEEAALTQRHEFKCTSVHIRDLWKAHILVLTEGKMPRDLDVKLLPGQIMQIERMIEQEERRRLQRALGASPRMLSIDSDASGIRTQPANPRGALQKAKSSVVFSSEHAKPRQHKFYKDGRKGIPSYFFESISRDTAEAILTVGSKYGNLLMRRSTTFPNSYALTYRSTANKKIELFHYEIGPLKRNNTLETYFELKMEGKHPKFKCLNDVVKYFARLTDGMAHAFTVNDVEKLGIKLPPYATHYVEPPADYDDDSDHEPDHKPPPTAAASKNHHNASKSDSASKGDPNSDEISIVDDSDKVSSQKNGSVTSATPPLKPPLEKEDSNASSASSEQRSGGFQTNLLERIAESQQNLKPVERNVAPEKPERRAEQQAVPPPPPPPAPPTAQKVVRIASFAETIEQKKPITQNVSIKENVPAAPPLHNPPINNPNKQSPINKPAGGATPPAPPPPAAGPLPVVKKVANETPVVKSVVKRSQPDRKQFAPEKNIFRLALECEQIQVAVASEEPTLTAGEVAMHLKGHVKTRVASLEIDGDKPAPNFVRPAKKDFMGELAEKLKVRRQVVEQTCW